MTSQAATSSDDLHVTEQGYVATVEINRPPNNFFDADLISRVADALDALAAGPTCRAVVLRAAGKHFCAGADFGQPRTSSPGPDLYEMALRLFEQPLPIVAAIQGAAIGGGLGLALTADFRVATPAARFTANFAQLGFHHGFGLTVTLPRLVGQQAALDLLYTGRRIDGEEAHRIGLCDQLVPVEDLHGAALEFAERLAASAPLAVRSIRRTMRDGLGAAIREAIAKERPEQVRLMGTADWKEGVAAAAERRIPRFSGR
jgi:enoyl-CoA hydratase/carnithine racemase